MTALSESIRIGALVPLTRPGWTEAGRHLLAGFELAVRDVNESGGIGDPDRLRILRAAGQTAIRRDQGA